MILTLCQFRKSKSKKCGASTPGKPYTSVVHEVPNKSIASNVELVETYIEGIVNHNVEEGFSVVAPNAILIFKTPDDNIEYTIRQFKEEAILLYASFPDFTVKYDTIVETSPGIVFVKGWQASGTHSGAPYAFGPYPAIEATDVCCKNDIEMFHFFCKEGLIHRIEVKALGPKSGLAGLYQQIGGLII